MNSKVESKKREEFCKILFDLAKENNFAQDAHSRFAMYKRLELLYDADRKEDRFRHYYSDIFSVLTQIQQNEELGSIDSLGDNLNAIKEGYQPINKAPDGRLIDINSSINKLYDHINLDISRINYSDASDRKLSGDELYAKVQSFDKQIGSVKTDLLTSVNEIKNQVDEVEKKLDNSQKEYISILGIFSSVVLAFVGGLTFNTSVLNNIAKASIYRLIVISLIIGFVLSNIIFGLFYYVGILVNKKLNTKPIIIFDTILGALLLITLIAWLFGVVEIRDNNIGTSFLLSVKGLL